ncbi:hypothetical protein [Saccharothrix violaceirubra]|uniref:Uncharacterized protein n=1 Tax=Saccharothrix violaceirubra TaxID=413306 RepID=A0A7W7WU96_9PSEU|nr:hypothetical protein [Saccharothrix violaceirubra]MBB4964055.1 hypothetical protein [Saccharothrix violaceirubra]
MDRSIWIVNVETMSNTLENVRLTIACLVLASAIGVAFLVS